MEHAAVVDRVFKRHDLDCHFSRIVDVSVAVVDRAVRAVGYLLPSFVQRSVVQVDAQQLEKSLARWIWLQVTDLRQDRWHQVFVRLVVQVVVQDVQVVENTVGYRSTKAY